ncbi:25216_t:CDS:2, partial [Gigaspora margarita]
DCHLRTFKRLETTSYEGKSARKTELVDLSKITYCEAAVEQCPIYLILDTGSSKSLIKEAPIGVVKNFLIKINEIEIPIDVEVTKA